MITVFKNNKDKKPFYTTIEKMLERIRVCTVKPQIDKIRAEADPKTRKQLKGELPSILFAGTFKSRNDSDLIDHSGFCILDFDHVADLIAFKDSFRAYPFVHAAFISPSGDGLKVLVRIPADGKRHRGYYRGLMKIFPTLDSTSQNESRICYESVDPEIYINTESVEFDKFVDDPQKTPLDALKNSSGTNDYAKANVALEMIRGALNGEKHKVLLKASKLMGGYIAGGIISETEAIRLLENEIETKGVDDMDAARTCIRKGIDYGKVNPIEVQEFKRTHVYRQQPAPSVIDEDDDEDYSFLATQEDADRYVEQKRNGTFKMGDKTGFPKLDEYYRFKPAEFDMIIGHDNAGKSVVSWYFACLNALYNNAYYILFAGENKTGGVKAKIMEYYLCKTIEKMTEEEVVKSKLWVEDHFAFVRNDESFSYIDMINIGKKMLKRKKYTNFIIEPYNVLDKPQGNDHQYDYKAMLDLRMFIRQTGVAILLNVHAATEALRKEYPKGHEFEGYAKPPNKSDAEGGGKFPNKSDNFLSVHRMADHPTEWVWTEIHVQKIKESETGGKRTFKDEPFKMRMVEGGCGFVDSYGNNPVVNYHTNKPAVEVNSELFDNMPKSLVEKTEIPEGSIAYYDAKEDETLPF